MSQTRMTRAELEEENATLRGRLREARDLIDEALGLGDADEELGDGNEDDLDDEEDEDDGPPISGDHDAF